MMVKMMLSIDCLNCFVQAEEEPKVSDHRSPDVVHPDRPCDLTAFHQVRMFTISQLRHPPLNKSEKQRVDRG